ncbi:STAS domain-containing protein [Streptosporangium sp. NPDC050855]|uniref:STAS domain-containing protein n=1 Tax=Streptosporangium sp. NPDC050855 TaxID=3366194 RepID=UPI0037A5E75A
MSSDPFISSLSPRPTTDDFDALLEVRTWRLESLRILRLLGELDVSTAPRVRAILDKVVSAPHEPMVIVDLTQLTFIASAGVGLLVEIRRRVGERGGRLIVILAPGSSPRRLFDLTGMRDYFEVAESLREAVGVLKRAEGDLARRGGTGEMP